jgi:hypothetical protein
LALVALKSTSSVHFVPRGTLGRHLPARRRQTVPDADSQRQMMTLEDKPRIDYRGRAGVTTPSRFQRRSAVSKLADRAVRPSSTLSTRYGPSRPNSSGGFGRRQEIERWALRSAQAGGVVVGAGIGASAPRSSCLAAFIGLRGGAVGPRRRIQLGSIRRGRGRRRGRRQRNGRRLASCSAPRALARLAGGFLLDLEDLTTARTGEGNHGTPPSGGTRGRRSGRSTGPERG